MALGAAGLLTDGPDASRSPRGVGTRGAPPPPAAPAAERRAPPSAAATVAPAPAPTPTPDVGPADDPAGLREALQRARATGERPVWLAASLRRALEHHDLELALLALDLLADVDPAEFRATVLGLVSRSDGDTVVLGAALLSLERLQGGDLGEALEVTRRSQWSAVQRLSRRADARPGELEQRRGYVRFAVDELVARSTPGQLAARLVDGRVDADERLLLAARVLDREDAEQLLAPGELAALARLLAADLRAVAAGLGHDDDEHDELLDPADEATLRARLAVLASLPGEAGREALRGLIADQVLPRDLAGVAAEAAQAK